MRTFSIFILLVAAAAVLPMPAATQTAQELEKGTAEEQRIRGTALSLASESLAVDIHPNAVPTSLGLPAVGRLEQGRGVPSQSHSPVRLLPAFGKSEQAKPWRRYALIGAAIGGAITATYFHFEVAPTWQNESNRGYGPSTGWGYVIYAAPGALGGSLVGAALAYRGSN